jgi:adenine/guanine phosphoribosyltransferase-like PRPP-binding protein
VNAKNALIAVGLATVAGCGTDVANRYYPDVHYPPKPVEQVELLKKEPTRHYAVIADFQARGETAQDMRRLAAKIGADAVIVTYLGGFYNSGDQWAGQDSQNNTYSRIVGTAVKYIP